MSIHPQNNRDLNQARHFALLDQIADSSLNRWRVNEWTSSWLTPTRIDADNITLRPKLASGKNIIKNNKKLFSIM